MRQGEIAALKLQDIGEDRIYIRHSWGKYDGLKTPKNGEEKSYQLNGCPNSGNHTGVIIENGKVKVQLKK